jgi:hypothetical protein
MRTHPMFVYLMSSGTSPYIGIATNPTRRVFLHNRTNGTSSGLKSTRSGSPHWRLRIVIGPFMKGSRGFHAQWRRESRKLKCRLIQGLLKVLSYKREGLSIWSDDPDDLIRMCLHHIRNHKGRVSTAFDPSNRLQVVTR